MPQLRMFDASAPECQGDRRECDWESFSEYALGKTGDVFAEGAGRFLKAGTQFRFNIHYAPNGTATTDQTSVALWLYPKGYVPKHQHVRRGVGQVADLDIPPGEISRHDGYTVLTENVRLTAYQPHLHNRGKRQCFETISPHRSCRDRELRGLEFRLAHYLQLRGRRAAAAAEGDGSAHHYMA